MSIGNKSKKLLFSTKAITKSQAIAIVIIIIVIVMVGAYYIGPPSTPGPTPTPTEPPKPTPTEQPQVPDLEVGKIMIDPAEPQAGNTFQAWIGIANIGNAKSGSYDLTIKIVDVSRGYTYPLGTFRQEPLDPTPPNQFHLVWHSDQLMVNHAGAHQLWAEITPIGFEDGDDSNNAMGWAFDVTS